MTATAFTSHADPVDPDRLRGVQQFLGLLDLLDEEPPAGLAERTLARIEMAMSGAPAGQAGFRPGFGADPSVPHA